MSSKMKKTVAGVIHEFRKSCPDNPTFECKFAKILSTYLILFLRNISASELTMWHKAALSDDWVLTLLMRTDYMLFGLMDQDSSCLADPDDKNQQLIDLVGNFFGAHLAVNFDIQNFPDIKLREPIDWIKEAAPE